MNAMSKQVPNQNVYTRINQRLSYMKDVAGYKEKNHLAVEDLIQEAKVLTSSVCEAQKLGLDEVSVRPFLQVQMDAAKAIQYRYRADWLLEPERDWQPTPLEQIRSELSVLNIQILGSVSSMLKTGGIFNDKSDFMAIVDQTHLTESNKHKLWVALTRIRLKD